MTLTADSHTHEFNFQAPGGSPRNKDVNARFNRLSKKPIKVKIEVDKPLPQGWRGWAYGGGVGDHQGNTSICAIEKTPKRLECEGTAYLDWGNTAEYIIFQLNYVDKNGTYLGYIATTIVLRNK
jgi:hypothetical protein